MDNIRAVDIGNNLSVGSRSCHVEVKQNFLWELKEAGIVEFQWVSSVSNEANMFMKNLAGPKHNKHAARLALCKMERDMSDGGCQELKSTHNRKSVKEV